MTRGWTPHKPEDRLSIVVSRFLEDALEPPFYTTALSDDDEGGRTQMQRVRGRERGQKPGQLDMDVVQGHWLGNNTIGQMVPLCRKLELKRGKNDLSEHQKTTRKKLIACGAFPIVAWTLRETHCLLTAEGFRFRGNVETLLQKYEAQLDALDRDAELRVSGVKQPKTVRKTTPRFTPSRSVVRRAATKGVRI